jgi:hypothetical protein
MVASTDPAVIEAVKRNGLHDPIGQVVGGVAYVYAWSLARWRARDSSSAPHIEGNP